MRVQRRSVTPEIAGRVGEAVTAHLLEQECMGSARAVALYASLADEVSTRPLFEALRSRGVICVFPRVLTGWILEFAPVADWRELQPCGRISEPPAGVPAWDFGEGDTVIVPGVAFDAAGNRLGRGRGCYDRAFPSGLEGPRLLGLGFAFQVVARVPCDSRDRPMDAIVTEDGFRWAVELPR